MKILITVDMRNWLDATAKMQEIRHVKRKQ